MTSSTSVQIDSGAGLYTRGRMGADITNAGTLSSYGGDLVLNTETLTNTGVLANAGGTSLFVNAINLDHTGDVQVHAGGGVSFDQAILNGPGQTVMLLGGNLTAPQVTNTVGGTVRGMGSITGDLINRGQTDFFGDSQVYGDVQNAAGAMLGIRNGDLHVTGHTLNDGTIKVLNGNAYFEGGVTNNGRIDLDPALGVVNGDLIVTAGGYVVTDTASRLQLLGNFVNRSTRNADFHLPGTVSVFGWALPRPTLRFEVAGEDRGPSDSGYDRNFAVGELTIDRATMLLTDDYDNSPGGGDEALYADVLKINAGGSIDPAGLSLYYRNGGSVKQFFRGDANLDGAVNVYDLAEVANHYGHTGMTWADGDSTGDGAVNVYDLAILANNYGATTGGGQVIPEPATILIVTAAGLPMLLKRKRNA